MYEYVWWCSPNIYFYFLLWSVLKVGDNGMYKSCWRTPRIKNVIQAEVILKVQSLKGSSWALFVRMTQCKPKNLKSLHRLVFENNTYPKFSNEHSIYLTPPQWTKIQARLMLIVINCTSKDYVRDSFLWSVNKKGIYILPFLNNNK